MKKKSDLLFLISLLNWITFVTGAFFPVIILRPHLYDILQAFSLEIFVASVLICVIERVVSYEKKEDRKKDLYTNLIIRGFTQYNFNSLKTMLELCIDDKPQDFSRHMITACSRVDFFIYFNRNLKKALKDVDGFSPTDMHEHMDFLDLLNFIGRNASSFTNKQDLVYLDEMIQIQEGSGKTLRECGYYFDEFKDKANELYPKIKELESNPIFITYIKNNCFFSSDMYVTAELFLGRYE